MNRKKELFQNTIIIGIGSIFTKAISFVLLPLFTLWLTPSEYGNYDLLFSYVSLLVPIITLQLEQAVLRYTLEEKDKGPTYFKSTIWVVFINSIFVFLLFGIGFRFNYHWPFIFCAVSFALQIFSTEYLRGRNELSYYSFSNILCGILTILFSYLMVKVLGYGVDGLLIAFGLSYLLTAIMIIVRQKLYKELVCFSIDINLFKKLLVYSLPLLPNALSWWITSVSDRSLIYIFLGSDQSGIYAVSTKIPTLIAVFYSIFNLAWQQSAIVSSSDNIETRKEFYNSTFSNLFIFLFSSSLGIVAVTPFLYRFFIGEEYISGIKIVPILILGTIFLNLSQYLGGILLGNKDTKTNGFTTVVGAIINLLINLAMINLIGLYAAAVSTLMSYIVMFLLRLHSLRLLFNTNKIIINVSVVTLFLIAFSYVLINVGSFLQMLLLLLVSILFIYLNRNIIFGILNQLKG